MIKHKLLKDNPQKIYVINLNLHKKHAFFENRKELLIGAKMIAYSNAMYLPKCAKVYCVYSLHLQFVMAIESHIPNFTCHMKCTETVSEERDKTT